MITAAQIRGARAMTAMSVAQLADASQLTVAQIEAIEAGTDPGDSQSIGAIRAALESRGVQFQASGSQDGGGAGLRLKQTHEDAGTRPENLNSSNDD
jgi:transcriptional regulator with XRE-family HTH domain